MALSRKADSRQNRRQTGSEAGHVRPVQRRRSDKVIDVDLEKSGEASGMRRDQGERREPISYSFVGFHSESVL